LLLTFTADEVADECAKLAPEDIDVSDAKGEEEDDKTAVNLAKVGKRGVLVTESIDGEDEEDDEGDTDDEVEGEDSDESESEEDKSSIVSVLFVFLNGSLLFNSNCC
jgi:hypothetical protein